MSADIAARLRVWSIWLDERIPDTEIGNDLREAAAEIERLRAERDEARREVCEMISDADESSKPESAEQVANRRGWDCCKENSDEQ